MKKFVLVVLMAALLPHFSYGAAETPLLPEVKKALEVPPLDEKEMAQNSYVYLLTIDAKDDDYVDIARKYLMANNQWLKQAVKDYDKDKLPPYPNLTYDSILDRKIDGKDYVFPCNTLGTSLVNPPCLAAILANKQQTLALIDKNQKILTRYKQVIVLPNFHPYNYANYPLNQTFLFQLELLRAVYAIDEGNINKGLDILQQQVDFTKKGFVSTDMTSRIVMRTRLITEYHIISDLLNAYPDLVKEPNLPKIRALLGPLPNYNLNLKEAMLNYSFNILLDSISSNEDNKKEADKTHLTYNQNETLNKSYLANEPYIKFTQLTLPEMQHIYVTNVPINPLKECSLGNDSVIRDCDKDNQFGDFAATAYKEGIYRDRFYQLYDVYNYLALVNLQLEILARGLTAEQVPAFLATAGDKAVNIITQKPFVWDKEKSTINTNYLTSGDSSRNPMAVKIKFNQ